jgi:hypothetical protein
MAKFFNNFPKVFYNLSRSSSNDVVTNITSRYAIEKALKENTASYYNYYVRDGETPEVLAAKIYNSPERHWIILLFNDIIDPQNDWPKDQRTFNEFILRKYSTPEYADTANTGISGITWANSNDKEFYKVEKTTNQFNEINEVFTTLDKESYDSFVPTGAFTITLPGGVEVTRETYKDAKTFFQYETELNEQKREIKLLSNEFVSGLETQLEEFLNE